MEMVKAFKEHQNVYKENEKYFQVEIKNDENSWKRVYWTLNISDQNE